MYARSYFLEYGNRDPDLEGLEKLYVEWRDYKEYVVVQNQSDNLRVVIYWNFQVQYAGYIVTSIETSNSTNNYVEAVYISHGVNYDEKVSVVAGGSAYFPVLPSTVQVRIGNNTLESSTGRVTITLYY